MAQSEPPPTVTAHGEIPTVMQRVPAGTVLGRYILMGPLGEGGSGIVYAAYDPELDRKVAIKLVRPLVRTQARLLREAQAMARLSHPNVVVVHDVGTYGDSVFVAMEFVDGGTLREWRQREHRSTAEILAAYRGAGRGLAAAHAAGFVHRDFKPDNVLVGRDGSVRVTDFGLVLSGAPSTDDDRDPSVPRPAMTASAGPGAAVAAVGGALPISRSTRTHETRADVVLGTTGYIAPEQYGHAKSDARTDQFSFCASLYEALYGQVPFEGKDDDAVESATLLGKLPAVDRSAKVPAHVHKALARGLSVDPAARFASMTELLAELDRDPDAQRRRVLAIAGGVVAIGLVAWGARATSARQEKLCRGAEEQLAGVWDAPQRGEVRAAFAATKAAYADGAFAGVAAKLDGFAKAWVGMRTESCEASRIRGEQSEQVLTLRMACLDTRLREVRSLVEVMKRADREVVAASVEAAGKLSPIEDCADVAALTAPVAAPGGAEARAKVEALRGRLAEARARASAGKFADAVQAETGILHEARETMYAPLIAEALVDLGTSEISAGHYDDAERWLREAAFVADEAHHDEARGWALVQLSEVSGRWLGHYAPAADYAIGAMHVARRIGNARIESFALDQASREHGYLGELDRALDEGRASLALTERLFGANDLRLARVHATMSVALAEMGRWNEAEGHDRLALAIAENALGPHHPNVALYLENLALDLTWSGRPADALAFDRRGEELVLAELGPEHARYADALNNTAYSLIKLGRFAEGYATNEKSLAIFERNFGADHVENTYPLVGMGEALLGLGEPSRALPLLERATTLAESHGLDAETMGDCHFLTGRALWESKSDRARAVVLVTKAQGEYAKVPRLDERRARAADWLAKATTTSAH